MPRIRITKTSAESLKYAGRQEEYFDIKLTGFGVRVNQNGSSYFAQGKIRLASGKSRKFNKTIGRVGIMHFDDALLKAREILEDAARGMSPKDKEAEARRAAEKDGMSNITLREAYRLYVKAKAKLKQSTRDEYLKSLERNCPEWLDMPLRELTGAMCLLKHAEIGRRSPAQADNLMRIIRAICQFMIDIYDDLEILSRNPVRKLSVTKAWFRLPRKTRYIPPADLPAWFAAVESLEAIPRTFLQLLIFSGARFTETAALKPKNFNFPHGSVVFRKTKTGKPLEVPLSSYMRPLLENYIKDNCISRNDYLFPSLGWRPSQTGHIEDLRRQFDRAIAVGAPDFNPHDLRRSFLSYCETLRIPKLMQKRLVGHAVAQDVTDGYIQISFDDMRQAVDDVTAYILAAAQKKPPLSGREQAAVVPQQAVPAEPLQPEKSTTTPLPQ